LRKSTTRRLRKNIWGLMIIEKKNNGYKIKYREQAHRVKAAKVEVIILTRRKKGQLLAPEGKDDLKRIPKKKKKKVGETTEYLIAGCGGGGKKKKCPDPFWPMEGYGVLWGLGHSP